MVVLAISSRGSGFEEGTDESLKPTTPAPGGWTEALRHHRTVSVEEFTESLARHQDWFLRKDKYLHLINA